MLFRPFKRSAVTKEVAGTLKHAIKIASTAHRGQVDKPNEPYILHPMRLVEEWGKPEPKKIA